MKKRLLLATPIVMLAASVASASNQFDLVTPYIGVDAQLRTMCYQKESGQNLFKHTYPQGNIYVGLKFGDYVAIEGGYEATFKTDRTVIIPSGQPVLDRIPVENETHDGSARFHGWHVDLVGFLPICNDTSLIGSVGMAGLTAKFTDTITALEGVPGFELNKFQQCKTVLRLGAGISHLITDCVGFRGMVYWENTRRFNLNGPSIEPAILSVIKARDSITYSLGLFVQF